VPQPPGRLPPLGNTAPVWNRTWIAVAQAAEIPDNAPVQVLIAGEAWVITRMDGQLTAFEDRCPHRYSPLSAGSVSRADDGSPRLTCAVHGWRFDVAGQCDLMPGDDRPAEPRPGHHGYGHHGHHGRHGWHGRHDKQGRADKDARRPENVMLRRAFGITQRYGLVWLAVDEPLAPLPEFPEWADDAMDGAHCRPVRVQAGAGQVIDGALGAAAAVTTDGWRVTGVVEGPSPDEDGGQAPGRHRVIKTAGPSATAHLRRELPHATIAVLITAQPEGSGSTRVFKLIARDGLGADPALVEKFVAEEDNALAEELALLEGYAALPLPLDAEAAGPLNLAWRRLMARADRG
jgi:nitrite reductase/ring-hydroxylating ferredoxin subunit